MRNNEPTIMQQVAIAEPKKEEDTTVNSDTQMEGERNEGAFAHTAASTVQSNSYGSISTNHNETNSNNNVSSNDESIDLIRDEMQLLHDSGVNFTYQWRMQQLRTLQTMIDTHWDEFIDALYVDLHKSRTEAVATELLMIRTDLNLAIRNLRSWMKTRSIPAPALCFPSFSSIQHRPMLGPAVLILGPFNYPLSLILQPTIGALAAGNPVIIKPSELTPTVGNLVQILIKKYFPINVLRCVVGDIPITTHLLSYPWGRIFFTGSARVGTIVATAAARTMTPITLECGGKSPCYIDTMNGTIQSETKLLEQIAQRIIWSKTLNCGQTCAAPDTVICCYDLIPYIVPHFISQIETMFGTNPMETSEIGRIVSIQHAQRLYDMIKEVEDYIENESSHNDIQKEQRPKCEIVAGGTKYCNVNEKYIGPTIIVNPPAHCRMMQEEIFGPILPIITTSTHDCNYAIQYLRTNKHIFGTPLCLYIFTKSNALFQHMVQSIPAGSVVRNDCLIHLSSPYVPFSGLGSSGYGGNYHGKYTFDLFTHPLPFMYRPMNICPHLLYDHNLVRCYPSTPFKQFVLFNIVMNSPSIPVLHLKWVLVLLTALLAIFLGVWFGL